MAKYDVVVIGAGPAGEKGACQAAYFGKRVAIIEKEPQLGGACCNTGTIPSKSLRQSALYLASLVQLGGLGGILRKDDAKRSAAEFMVRKDEVIAFERDRIANNLEFHGVEVLHGAARFEDPHTLRVGEDHVSAETILIAVGSTPFHPPNIPWGDPLVDDSDTILCIDEMPQRMVIVGGGVVGCEYACMFAALGVQITLIEPGAQTMAFLDDEINGLLDQAMKRRLGIDLRTGDKLAGVESDGKVVHVKLASGKELVCDRVLASVGRGGNTKELALETTGLKADAKGQLTVNEHFQTAVPNIYAAGDVVGFPSLASASMEQARVAMTHACGQSYKQHLSPVLPFGIYTIPEISMVGETEESAQQKGIDYEIGRALYRKNARGQMIGDLDGLLKLVFRVDDKKLLGVSVIGERATELIHIGQACLSLGATIDYFVDAIFNYPTLAEMYKYAGYDGLSRLAARNPRASS
jgi:NAD(P) transhydrogenase